ncbi:MAG: hypothetical protein KJ623_04615 [Nanoarchaeota archaeon]|nr:hypothetical protein [Nanoarchaeota archaeon]MBU0962603.1 hypothetical protein [Nanoarchaeota archaeon]
MQLNKLFKQGRKAIELLEYYDNNGKLLIGRKRIDITLDKKLILKLREESKNKNIPLSRLIESKLV